MLSWADRYETPEFIKHDPIQFPHRFVLKQDIEISAFLTAYLSFGQRPQIIRKVEELHTALGDSPYNYIYKGDFSGFPTGSRKFYRFVSYDDIHDLLAALHDCYLRYADLEAAVVAEGCAHPLQALQKLFGHINYIPSYGSVSACKRMNMFLRWVGRQDSCVDFGIWPSVDMAQLFIPVDTHVHQVSLQLGITRRKSADRTTMREINDFFKKIFPGDPSRGDFALFGYGVDR